MSDYERGLAQDIQEHVVRIYEACNFQDLAGQRIGKVIAHAQAGRGAARDRCWRHSKTAFRRSADQPPAAAPARELINGPKLDGDAGHASQHDIDTMFN